MLLNFSGSMWLKMSQCVQNKRHQTPLCLVASFSSLIFSSHSPPLHKEIFFSLSLLHVFGFTNTGVCSAQMVPKLDCVLVLQFRKQKDIAAWIGCMEQKDWTMFTRKKRSALNVRDQVTIGGPGPRWLLYHTLTHHTRKLLVY